MRYPTDVLREMKIGDRFLFQQYTKTSQVASAVQRVRRALGYRFTTALEPGAGVAVTRIDPVAHASDSYSDLL